MRLLYLNFNLWMKDEKKVAMQTGFMSCHVVEEIIRIGQIKGWDVPQFHLPKTETANQLWNTKSSKRTNKTKPIPEDVFDKILYHAVHDEKDVLTKAGIIIQSQTGLRINEVLSIQEGCVKCTSDGYDYMEVTLAKTEKGEPIIHKVFINDIVKDAIAELSEYTAELRKESGLKELFVIRNHGIRALNVAKWNENRLSHFIERYGIRDNKGELYPLTSHQFRATFVRERTKKPFGTSMQRSSLNTLKSIIRWCQLHRPNDVPTTEIFTGNEYIGVNRKLKIDFIPDDVVAQINEALKKEENPYLKYGIIILQSTGMRIGDLLKLHIDCIKPHLISGYTIEWTQHKGHKDKPPMPVRSECVAAIEKLIKITAELRDEADEKDKDTLMIWRVPKGKCCGKVIAINAVRFNNKWMKKFIKKNNIKDANGDYYNLTSHQFRRTLGTDMLSKGTNINVIQQVLGHSDPSVTKRFYADVKDKERAEVFKSVGVIGNINQIQSSAFDNVSEFEWFKANKDKGACMCDGYCTKPVVDGKICDRLIKRQKCYTCSRYITTPEYLEAHKKHLANLEKQLEEGAIYGEHYAEHFIPTIEVLKVIIERLEGLQNGN